MNTVELTQYAMGNAFAILDQVVADLTQEQADWAVPGIANPIGALYWHTVSGADEVVYKWCRGQEPLYEKDGWREKALTIAASEPEHPDPEGYLDYMRTIRVSLPALHEYAKATAQAIQEWLASLTPADLEREMETPIGKLSVAQMLETFVIWHINAHCGEISALKGCQGVKGYPF